MSELTRQKDFFEFWDSIIEQAFSVPTQHTLDKISYPIREVEAYSLRFNGVDETFVEGLYMRRSQKVKAKAKAKENEKAKAPLLVLFHGYSGNAGRPADMLAFALLGYNVLSISARNQGGNTFDAHTYSSGGENNTIAGILDHNDYYYKWVISDYLRAIAWAASQEEVDENNVVVSGGSQGGGLSLIVAALSARAATFATCDCSETLVARDCSETLATRFKITHCFCDCPSYSDIQDRMRAESGSYGQLLAKYVKLHPHEQVRVGMELSYFDVMNFADMIECDVHASVGANDHVAPPHNFYEAYNRINSPKEIISYPFRGHEGGAEIHREWKLNALSQIL